MPGNGIDAMSVTNFGVTLTEKQVTPSERAADPAPAPRTWGSRLLLILVGLLLWMITVVWPFTTGALGYEESWVQTLHYGFLNGWQWGSDLIFTYGPLGFLLTYEYVPETFPYVVAWNILGHGACVAFAVYYASRMGSRWATATFLGLLLILASFEFAYGRDHFYLVTLWLMCCGYVASRSVSWWPLLSIFAVGTVLSLAKFTFLPVYLGIGGVLLIHIWFERGWKRTVAAFGIAVGMGLAGWLACGQHLASLPRHIRGSLEISRGYSFAMMGPFGEKSELVIALILLGVFTLGWLVRLRDAGTRRSRMLMAITTGLVTFLVWKHGFVRHDGHSFVFFSVLSCLACGAWLQAAGTRVRGQVKGLLTIAVIVVSLFCMFRRASMDHIGITPLNAPILATERMVGNAKILFGLRSYSAEQAKRRVEVSKAEGLVGLRERIGNEPIAWLMNSQSQPLVTGAALYPRGVIQSYSAYTEWLANEDARCFQRETAPRFAAVRVDLADGRFPMGDDGPAIVELLNRYRPVANFGGAVLLEKRSDSDTTSPAAEDLADRQIEIGESFTLPESGGDWIVASLDVRHSSWGKFVTSIFKSPHVRLHVEGSEGTMYDYQLIPEMSRTWFLVDPLVTDVNDFAKLASGVPEKRVRRFVVHIATGDRACFEKSVRVRLRRQPALPRQPEKVLDALLAPGLYTRPAASESPKQGIGLLHGRSIYKLAAPGWAKLPLPQQATKVRGFFGQFEQGGDDEARLNGVTFAVTHLDDAGRATSLFQRKLNPWKVPEDRGEQKFEVSLSGLHGGSIRIETHAGRTWSEGCYWGDLRWE